MEAQAVDDALDLFARVLDAAWRQMADRLEEAGADAKVEIVVPEGGGRARLSVDKLGAVGEPESLTWLKTTTEAMLPRIELPDLQFEVHSWTGSLDAFGHVSERRTRMEGLLVSLVALLGSQSCNIGLTPVIARRTGSDPLAPLARRSNYLRADTASAANAEIIAAQSRIELAQMWGGGLLASVDGLRFVVPVKSINTGPSPKYYGYKRGLTWLNAVNDQVAGSARWSCAAPRLHRTAYQNTIECCPACGSPCGLAARKAPVAVLAHEHEEQALQGGQPAGAPDRPLVCLRVCVEEG